MKKLKVAVIGVGNISQFHIEAYMKNPNAELYAFCDINEKTLNAKGAQYGVERLYLDKDKMLSELPEIDFSALTAKLSAQQPQGEAPETDGEQTP